MYGSKLSYLIVLIQFILISSNSKQGFVTFYYKCAFLLINVTFIHLMCYDALRVVVITAETNLTHHCLKEKTNE